MTKGTDFSLPGAILIVVSQLFASFQSSDQISKEIEKFRKDFQQSLIDRETYFVRKTELSLIGKKIDGLNSRVIRMSEQINTLKNEYYSQIEDDSGIVGCIHKKRLGI